MVLSMLKSKSNGKRCRADAQDEDRAGLSVFELIISISPPVLFFSLVVNRLSKILVQ